LNTGVGGAAALQQQSGEARRRHCQGDVAVPPHVCEQRVVQERLASAARPIDEEAGALRKRAQQPELESAGVVSDAMCAERRWLGTMKSG